MRKARAASSVIVLLLALGGIPAAGAEVSTLIVPGQSLGPIRLGMSADDVARILGQPSPAPAAEVAFPEWAVTVTFSDGVAARISTTNPQFRTASGAGVGTRIDDVTRLVGDTRVDMSVVNGTMQVLYPARGIGFVFYRGVAVEVFVIAPGQVAAPPVPAPPGALPPRTLTLVLGPAPAPPPAPPAPKLRSVPTGARPELALEDVTSSVDAVNGLFRVSGEVVNVGSSTADGVTVAVTFLKRSGDETRRQVVVAQPVEAGASVPFTLQTPLLQTVVGADFVVRYTAEATARDGGLTLVQSSYAVPPETYADLARGQVTVDVQFGGPSNTIPRAQVLVAISGTGSIPPTWIRDVLVEIPFASGSVLVHLRLGEIVTLLVPPVVVAGVPFGGFFAPAILGRPAVLTVALAAP